MQLEILHGVHSKKLILFFNGWGMDSGLVKHLLPEDYQVIEVHDYTEMSFRFNFEKYNEINIIAWSMGVWAASVVLPDIQYNNCIAINGTPFPCHNTYGIPEDVFEGTLKNWNEKNREKFERRVCGLSTAYDHFKSLANQRNTESQRLELKMIYDLIKMNSDSSEIQRNPFQNAVIGTKDLIYSLSNQLNSWSLYKVNHVVKVLPHFPFEKVTKWSDILAWKQ